MLIEGKVYKTQKCKNESKGEWPESRDLLINFGTPNISGTAYDAKLKFYWNYYYYYYTYYNHNNYYSYFYYNCNDYNSYIYNYYR